MDAGPASPALAPVSALSQRRLRRQAVALVIAGLVLAGAAAMSLFTAANGTEWVSCSVMFVALFATFPLLLGLRSSTPTATVVQPKADEDGKDALLHQLGTALHDGVVIICDEHVRYANPAATALLGLQPGQCASDGLLQALPVAETNPGDVSTTQSLLLRADGQSFRAELALQRVQYQGAACRLVVVRDLSELESGRTALATSNAELQAMAGRLFSVQEDERRSISRDLHDDIGQAITAMKLAACAARDEEDTPRRQEDIDQIIELADSTVTKLRNLSMLLRPPQLDALGLEAALRWQAGMLFRATPVELLLHVDTLSHRPSNEVEQACFRIAQESLTNALRHARASQVSLLLRDGGDGELHLQVIDDGEGFDLAAPRGLGMIVMRERAQSAGGSLHIETAPGEGTCINLRLPCSSAAC
jgi:signal transduction histidine kinase